MPASGSGHSQSQQLKPNAEEVRVSARQWLRTNDYDDIADMIDTVMRAWERQEKKTRRDWYQVLAGDKNGAPRSVEGMEFPVLKAAQRRMGMATTRNAIERKRGEVMPPIISTGRWTGRTRKRR